MELIFIGTVIEVTVVLIAFAVLYIGSYFIQNNGLNNTSKQKVVKGIEARALILKIEETGTSSLQQLHVKLQIQVLPEKGRNFVTEIKTVLSSPEIKTIKNGSIITVFYDPANTKEVAFLNVNRD